MPKRKRPPRLPRRIVCSDPWFLYFLVSPCQTVLTGTTWQEIMATTEPHTTQHLRTWCFRHLSLN